MQNAGADDEFFNSSIFLKGYKILLSMVIDKFDCQAYVMSNFGPVRVRGKKNIRRLLWLK